VVVTGGSGATRLTLFLGRPGCCRALSHRQGAFAFAPSRGTLSRPCPASPPAQGSNTSGYAVVAPSATLASLTPAVFSGGRYGLAHTPWFVCVDGCGFGGISIGIHNCADKLKSIESPRPPRFLGSQGRLPGAAMLETVVEGYDAAASQPPPTFNTHQRCRSALAAAAAES
jgi:hypothetical protein